MVVNINQSQFRQHVCWPLYKRQVIIMVRNMKESTYDNILELIGNTPLVRLRTGIPDGGPVTYAKLEFLNPSGSVKDRMAYHIIRKAFREGRIKPGDTVVDNTSGNTGVSLAMTAAVLGLKAVVTAPAKTSQEKIDLLKSYGTRIIITPTEAAHDDPEGCYMTARRLARENDWFDLDQYDNAENAEAHYLSTGPEIWSATNGKITHFVCGIGTGGTLSGAARYLKEKNPKIQIVAVDPEGSIFVEYIRNHKLTEGSVYKVEGIGSDVITKALDPDVIDEVITVSDRDAFETARHIARTDGISGGGSSGAVAFAMSQKARGLAGDSLMVGIFADSGIRYLSKFYNDEWMRTNDFPVNEEVGEI